MIELPSETFVFKFPMKDNESLISRIQSALDINGWFVELGDIRPIIVGGECISASVDYYLKLTR